MDGKSMFARVARNEVKIGYFRTDDETVREITRRLVPGADEGVVTMIDPCAGEGLAADEISRALVAKGANVRAYGVELDAQRFREAARRIPCIMHADVRDARVSRGVFALVFLNPPYGWAEKAGANEKRLRLEEVFVRRALPWAAPSGVAVLIIPHYTIPRIIPHLKGWGWFIGARAMTDEFKQVVIFARKEHDPNRAKGIEMLQKLAEKPEEFPRLSELDEEIIVPAGRTPTIFEAFGLTQDALEAWWETHEQEHDAVLRWVNEAQRTIGAKLPPLVPPRPGHFGAILAAGAANGVFEDDSGRRWLLRGSSYRTADSRTETEEDADGNKRRVQITRFFSVSEIVLVDERSRQIVKIK